MANSMAIEGNFQRFIKLDAPIEVAYAYFSDFNHVLPRLPDIERVLRYRDGRYRMIFGTDDGRGHGMGIVFDVRNELEEHRQIKMLPVPVSRQELESETNLSKTGGPLFPGSFHGEVFLTQKASQVEVSYRVNLTIEIDVPRFLNFMPTNMLEKLGDSVMQLKLHSIGDGFIDRLAGDFPAWHSSQAHRFVHHSHTANGASQKVVVPARAAANEVLN